MHFQYLSNIESLPWSHPICTKMNTTMLRRIVNQFSTDEKFPEYSVRTEGGGEWWSRKMEDQVQRAPIIKTVTLLKTVKSTRFSSSQRSWTTFTSTTTSSLSPHSWGTITVINIINWLRKPSIGRCKKVLLSSLG